MGLRLCGVILIGMVLVCGTIILIRMMENRAASDAAWSMAFTQRGQDRNDSERREWIAANCELAAQVEELRGVVKDLTCENDRMRDLLKVVKLGDLKKAKEAAE